MTRVLQLIGKTNQFNLTTRRHPPEVVAKLLADPKSIALTCAMWDRFGDHGLIAVMLGAPVPDALVPTVRIDTWLMSCRVIARTAEQFFFGVFLEEATARGYARILGEYIPTAKNGQVEDLYQRLGFTAQEPLGQVRRWGLEIAGAQAPGHFIERVLADAHQNSK